MVPARTFHTPLAHLPLAFVRAEHDVAGPIPLRRGALPRRYWTSVAAARMGPRTEYHSPTRKPSCSLFG